MHRLTILGMLAALLPLPIAAIGGGNDDDHYVKVEIKGVLETGVMAIGGESTGTLIRVKNVTWELDLGNRKDFQDAAKMLDKKTVLVTGTYQKKTGVEIPERHIVTVTSLKPADGK